MVPNAAARGTRLRAKQPAQESVATQRGLDSARAEALTNLLNQMRAGAPFSDKEVEILRAFGAGFDVSKLEADLVISRALYQRDVIGAPLTPEQQSLVDEYSAVESRRAAERNAVFSRAGSAGAQDITTAPANDTCAGAVTLSLNTPVNGTLAAATDDYELSGSACFTGVGNTASTAAGRDVVYKFTAPSAGTFSFRVNNATIDSNIVLYVASTCPGATPGTPVVVSTCLGAANRTVGGVAEEVPCLALTSGQTVYIFVDENATAAAATTFNIEVTQCTQEAEGNNTPATANPASCGVEGSIATAGDVDFYSLGSPANGSRVFAFVDGIASNNSNGADDFDLRVTNTTDTLEYDEGSNDAPWGSNAPNIAGTPLTGSAAYLEVNLNNAAQTGGPYRLYSVVQPPLAQATQEVEPNDSIATANTASNNYFRGTLSGPAPSADADYYAFNAAAGDLIFVSVDGDPERDNTPINPQLMLFDASQTLVASANDSNQGTVTTPGTGNLLATTPYAPSDALVYRALTAGTYYVKVSIGTSSTLSVGAGNYLLSISKNCQPGGGLANTADVSIAKSASPSPAVTGQPITYTLTVNNAGPNTASNVTVSDPLPAGTTYISCTTSVGTCSGPTVGTNGTVTADLGSLLNGSTATITIMANVTAAAGATLSNTATVSSPTNDGNTANNTATTNTAVVGPQANLSVVVFDSPDPVNAGSTLTYNVYVNNAGPSTATNVSVTYQLGPSVAFVSASAPAGWTCTLPAPGTTSGLITCSISSLAANQNGSLTVTTTVSANTPNNAHLTSTATVSSATSDPNTSDNSFTSDTQVTSNIASGGSDTPGVYNATNGTFFLKNSNAAGAADLTFQFGAGGASIIPLRGDWNGDGIDTVGIYNTTNGFFFLRNSNTPGPADLTFQFGAGGAGIVPVVGDWNGDGTDTIGIYNTATGVFFLKNTNASGPADLTFTFGPGGTNVLPITGDWNGDGIDTIGIYDQNTGGFFLKNTNASGPADLNFIYGPGGAGVLPVAGDYNNDGTDTVGIYISSTGGWFLKNTNASGPADITFNYGPPNFTPLVGDWDGL